MRDDLAFSHYPLRFISLCRRHMTEPLKSTLLKPQALTHSLVCVIHSLDFCLTIENT